jgi:hypothetical protein
MVGTRSNYPPPARHECGQAVDVLPPRARSHRLAARTDGAKVRTADPERTLFLFVLLAGLHHASACADDAPSEDTRPTDVAGSPGTYPESDVPRDDEAQAPRDLPAPSAEEVDPLHQGEPPSPLDGSAPDTTCDAGLIPAVRLAATPVGDTLRIEVLAPDDYASMIESLQLIVVSDDGSQNTQLTRLGAFDVGDVSTKVTDAATLIDVPLAELTSSLTGKTEFTGAIGVIGQG